MILFHKIIKTKLNKKFQKSVQHEYFFFFKISADFWSLSLNHVDTIPTTDVLFYATKRQDNGSTWNSLNNLNEALNFVQFPLSLFLSDELSSARIQIIFTVLVVSDCIHIAWSSVHFEKNHNGRTETIPGTLLPLFL